MPGAPIRTVIGLAFVCAVTIEATAQTAVVTRNVNLRQNPSGTAPILRLLTPPEELHLLSAAKTSGYYNVSTDSMEVGWVYGSFVRVDGGVPEAVVERNTNLRPTASSSGTAIRMLTPPEPLTLLEPTPTSNYYHVRTAQNEEGWAYAPNVLVSSGPPAPPTPPPSTPAFPDAHEAPPTGWSGPVFRLSQDYPTALPAEGPTPWKQFDFKTQADQYIRAVLAYAMEGNLPVDWRGQDNATRKWYHAPWLHTTTAGREFIHGMTVERSSRPGELHPSQTSTFRNVAVGMYNARGGYVMGRVWADPDNPDPTKADFPESAVAVKLLFTTATVAQVPYMKNAFEWDGFVAATGNTRTVQKVRLLQIDVAVRDSRANSTTGWVFGTFAYDGDAPGATPWDRMRPVGLMWGNDPTLTPTAHSGGQRATQGVILNPVIGTTQHLGWLGRLNGPVDNPRSSCLSCHSTAQDPPADPLPVATAPDSQKMRWFRNIKAGDPFDTGQTSLDYSLQLSLGLERFLADRTPPNR